MFRLGVCVLGLAAYVSAGIAVGGDDQGNTALNLGAGADADDYTITDNDKVMVYKLGSDGGWTVDGQV